LENFWTDAIPANRAAERADVFNARAESSPNLCKFLFGAIEGYQGLVRGKKLEMRRF
jgi:hypothetical protein